MGSGEWLKCGEIRRRVYHRRDFSYFLAYFRETRSLFAPPVSRAGKTKQSRLQRVYRLHNRIIQDREAVEAGLCGKIRRYVH